MQAACKESLVLEGPMCVGEQPPCLTCEVQSPAPHPGRTPEDALRSSGAQAVLRGAAATSRLGTGASSAALFQLAGRQL